MSIRTFSIGSGSSGNCYYLESENTKILVDCGISYTKVKKVLEERKIDLNSIDAIFITHEHTDHVSSLNQFIKNLSCNFYLSKGCLNSLEKTTEINEKIKIIKSYDLVQIKDIKVLAIEKPHDTDEALSYIFENSGFRVGFFTDLGYATDEINHILKTLNVVYLEANYCQNHIAKVKENLSHNYINRIVSDSGHLGIDQTIEVLKKTTNNEQKVILSHISENTNSYENAYVNVKKELNCLGIFPKIFVSFQSEPSEWFE